MIGGWRRRAGDKEDSGSADATRLTTDGPDPAPGGRPGARTERLAVDYARHPEASQAAIERLLEEYGRYVEDGHAICTECPVTRSGGFVARSMLEWKAIHGDGRLDRWACADIRKYGEHMHHRLARETSADDRLLDSLLDTPTCVRDMIYFLSDRGTPAADDPDALADAADETIGDLMVSRHAPQPASRKGTQASQAKRRKRKAVRAARRRNRG